MIPFGALIRESRESRGVSLRSLALAVDLTPGELRAIEVGREPPPVDQVVEAIADHLRMPAAALRQAAERGRRGVVPQDLRYRWRMRLYPLCLHCDDDAARCSFCGPLYRGALKDEALCVECSSPICSQSECERE